MPTDQAKLSFEIVSDPRSVVERFDPLAFDWGKSLESEWIFRGLGDSNFELLPTAWRSPPPTPFLHIEARFDHLLVRILEKIRSRDGVHLDRQDVIARRCYAELILIEEFLRITDTIGIPAPLHIGRDIEQSVLKASRGSENPESEVHVGPCTTRWAPNKASRLDHRSTPSTAFRGNRSGGNRSKVV